MTDKELRKFTNWLKQRGCEIIPLTSEYELLRFQGLEVGVFYKSGKVSGEYATIAFKAYRNDLPWNGAPKKINRKSYKKHVIPLLERDGENCFYCDRLLNDNISVEHLIALSSGGTNLLSNMVLAHKECNEEVGNLPIVTKVKKAIELRELSNFQLWKRRKRRKWQWLFGQQ